MAAPPPTPSPVAPPAPAPAPPPGEATWSQDEKREVQQALRTLGDLDFVPDGEFGPLSRTAITQFQSFQGDAETGSLTEAERAEVLDMAHRLTALLQSGPTSPSGVAAVSLRGGAARLSHAAELEGAGKAAEAAYWYRLAAADDEARAYTNLGTILVRGAGGAKPDPAAARLLWQAAAARGEAVAMFNLGAMYEHGVGVAADKEQARKWYQRAAALRNASARDALKRLAG
jgi:TPR repeat protein